MRQLRLVTYLVVFGIFAKISLLSYTQHLLNSKVLSARNPAELDAKGRRDAIVERKRTLPVISMPYAATSNFETNSSLDSEHLPNFVLDVEDEQSGLTIHIDSHLCFPGSDPCISGGLIAISDGVSKWQTTFRMLGSESPSPFQSHVPRSRPFLNRLRTFAEESNVSLAQPEYYDALKNMLSREKGSDEQRARVADLSRMLLRSYFQCSEFTDTVDFAEREGLIEPECDEMLPIAN
jgi:hypothetical protein